MESKGIRRVRSPTGNQRVRRSFSRQHSLRKSKPEVWWEIEAVSRLRRKAVSPCFWWSSTWSRSAVSYVKSTTRSCKG